MQADLARQPRTLCIHSCSPVAGSSATTARRLPAVEYKTRATGRAKDLGDIEGME